MLNIFKKLIGGTTSKATSAKADFKDTPILLSEGKTYWGTFRPIVNELLSQEIPFRYYTLDANDPALAIKSPYMQARPFARGITGFVKLGLVKTPLMLSTTPNIGNDDYPLKRSPHIKTLVHVFHALGNVEYYRKGSLDSYDAVAMAGEHQIEYIRTVEEARNLAPKELVALGLPYLDDMFHQMQKNEPPRKIESESPTVLVAPSWGDKGCFAEYGVDFVKQLSHSGYRIIIRLHPHSYTNEPDRVQSWEAELQSLPGVEWDRKQFGIDAMQQSDICISDTSSIRFDYAFLYNKPVITLSIPREHQPEFEGSYFTGSWDTDLAQEMGGVVTRAEIENISDIVKTALGKCSSPHLQTLRDEYISNFGNSAQAIVQYIQEKVLETAAKQ